MPLMNSALYEALIEAGVSEEKARKAAETLADYEALFVGLISDIQQIKRRIRMLIFFAAFIAGIVFLMFMVGAIWIG